MIEKTFHPKQRNGLMNDGSGNLFFGSSEGSSKE